MKHHDCRFFFPPKILIIWPSKALGLQADNWKDALEYQLVLYLESTETTIVHPFLKKSESTTYVRYSAKCLWKYFFLPG